MNAAQKAGVLAVLKFHASCQKNPMLSYGKFCAADDIEQACAAVAELIEECERLCDAADGMKRNADGMSRRSPIALTLRTAAANILSLRAALDRVGGVA